MHNRTVKALGGFSRYNLPADLRSVYVSKNYFFLRRGANWPLSMIEVKDNRIVLTSPFWSVSESIINLTSIRINAFGDIQFEFQNSLHNFWFSMIGVNKLFDAIQAGAIHMTLPQASKRRQAVVVIGLQFLLSLGVAVWILYLGITNKESVNRATPNNDKLFGVFTLQQWLIVMVVMLLVGLIITMLIQMSKNNLRK